ncbi:MAG: HEAT repeat domain-containing protein [Desulfovibrionales bacterium]|nr:HEAT repeat domain-containing protein [Desulfovibrionales bacterium]
MSIITEAQPPKCPFCGSLVDRPRELNTKRLTEFAMGRCQCGAVYACDVTGHNVGAAMVEALLFACGGDWDLAWQLEPDKDYIEDRIENYNEKEHKVVARIAHARAVLLFIRLGKEIREVSEDKVRAELAKAPVINDEPSVEHPGRSKSFSKKLIQRLVEENREEELLSMAKEDKRVLAALQRLLYSPDELLRWRAVEILGKAAGYVADKNPQAAADLLRRLLSSAADSAATSWGFLEAAGEIISTRPDLFAGFIPPLFSFLKDQTSRAAALWAIGRIGKCHPELLKGTPFFGIFDLLDSPEPAVRGHAAWALGHMKAKEAVGSLQRLKDDRACLRIYDDGRVKEKTVGELASQAIERVTCSS